MAAGDITDALVDELSLRTEDAQEKRFPEATKLVILNKAQKSLCNMLHDAYLTELEDIASAVSLTTLTYAITSLNTGLGVLRGGKGIKRVKFYAGGAGNGVWANEIEVDELKKMENTYLAHSDESPRYYVFKNTIYVLATTSTSSTADIYYLKMPTTMTTDVDPIINESLYGVLVTLAEAILWGMDAKLDRLNAAQNRALKEIEILNARYRRADGIGTINRERAENT